MRTLAEVSPPFVMLSAMAKKVETLVTLTDDLDGTKADRTVAFSWDGTSYEIDLSKKNANAMEKTLAPYVQAARRMRAGRSRTARPAAKRDLAAIRIWARSHGYEVSDRGRIPGAVTEAYEQAR